MVNWDDLQVLLAVHRTRTLAGAGRMLGVDATTVSRRLAALAERLGTRLTERTPEGLRLTAAGQRAVAVAERADELVTGLLREVSGEDSRVAGVVRITSGDGVLANVLVPALPRLYRQHPQLRVELLAATHAVDLSRREADVAVRLFRPREPSLVARRLGPLTYGLFASPEYLARAGTPRRTADLAQHEFVGFTSELDRTPEMQWLQRQVSPERFAVRCSTIPLVLAACRAGLGISAVAEALAKAEPGLVRVLPRAELPTREAWAVFHPDLRNAARITVVLDWIADAMHFQGVSSAARSRVTG